VRVSGGWGHADMNFQVPSILKLLSVNLIVCTISGFKKFFANKGYEGELKVRLTGAAGHQKDATKAPKCQIHCAECSLLFDNNDRSGKKINNSWEKKLIFVLQRNGRRSRENSSWSAVPT
jgi:hypothetical protein